MFSLIDMVIVRPIANALFIIYNFVGDFGLAIILFTLLVRLCLWPLVKKQLHQAHQMRKIQPELATIKKNCKGNRQLESLQMLDLYKRHNIKPFRSILTLFIQLPILIALYSSIKVIVIPAPTQNLSTRAYSFIQPLNQINEVIQLQENYLADPDNNSYEFKPLLFQTINLDAKAGLDSVGAVFTIIFAISAGFIQYFNAKQQQPSDKTKKSKKFRELLKEAADGKEPDQADISSAMSNQMAIMMPAMMVVIVINLPGALAFYYFFSSLVTVLQQKVISRQLHETMDNVADKAILKELSQIQEAEVITNKKTGTKITHISKKSKKRRK